MRIGVPRAPFFDSLDDEIAAAVEGAIGTIGKLTRSVTEMHRPSSGKYSRAYFDGEIEAFHWEWYQRKANSYSLNQRRTIEAVHRRYAGIPNLDCAASFLRRHESNPALDLSVRVSLFASGKTEGDISASLSFGGNSGS